MEKLLISLWFGTLAMSQHLPFTKSSHDANKSKERHFKSWLLSQGASTELSDKLYNHGITNLLCLYI